MKSTLPALFRIQSKEKPSKIALSPEKQLPFYSLNLTISHNYRTKIINPKHKQSFAQDKLPAKSKLKFKQRYSEYPSRSLSVQQDYSSIEYSTFQPPELKSSYSQNQSESTRGYALQQFDSIRINIKKVKQELQLLTIAVQDVPNLHDQYRNELSLASERLSQEVDQVETEMKGRIKKLGELLSTLRRQTNIEIRGMKREVGLMKEEVEEEMELVKDIDGQRTTIKKINF